MFPYVVHSAWKRPLIPCDLTFFYPFFESPLRHHSHQEAFLDFLLGFSPMNAYSFLKILSNGSYYAVGISCVFLCILPLTYKFLKENTETIFSQVMSPLLSTMSDA